MRRRTLLLLFLGIAAFLGVCFAIGFMSSPSQTLRAEVSIEGGALVIHNHDSRTWTDVTIRVNNRYTHRHDALQAGDTARIDLGRFTTTDGTRFSIAQVKPVSVYVKADVTSGGETADGGWSFQ